MAGRARPHGLVALQLIGRGWDKQLSSRAGRQAAADFISPSAPQPTPHLFHVAQRAGQQGAQHGVRRGLGRQLTRGPRQAELGARLQRHEQRGCSGCRDGRPEEQLAGQAARGAGQVRKAGRGRGAAGCQQQLQAVDNQWSRWPLWTPVEPLAAGHAAVLLCPAPSTHRTFSQAPSAFSSSSS